MYQADSASQKVLFGQDTTLVALLRDSLSLAKKSLQETSN